MPHRFKSIARRMPEGRGLRRGARIGARLILVSILVLPWSAGCSAGEPAPRPLRIATFNVSLNRETRGRLIADLAGGADRQARQIAAILQRVRPDVVLLNEFDYDERGEAVRLFHDLYLAVAQDGQEPLDYPYRYAPPVNTGVAANRAGSHFDFDNDGRAIATPPTAGDRAAAQAYGNDCYGFGAFPGQYGFVIFSRLPIRGEEARTFQHFKWRDMPGAVLPPGWYSAAELEVFRLSSKTHADVPIEVAPGEVFHLLASHPTPPSFDGPEDRNGRRNHDEIRLWADYIDHAAYIYDDQGRRGGFDGRRFVLLGDLNADPSDGGSYDGAIRQLLGNSRVQAGVIPMSPGGLEQAGAQGGANATQRGDPRHDTADFPDGPNGPGNLRVDYVLPSREGWRVVGGAVYWPASDDPSFALVGASDHRLVYLDLVTATP